MHSIHFFDWLSVRLISYIFFVFAPASQGYADTRPNSTAQDVLKSSQCEKPPALKVDKGDELEGDPCAEFHRLRRETSMSGGSGDGGDDDNKKSNEERLKQLKIKCFLGALAALLAGGLVCIYILFLYCFPTNCNCILFRLPGLCRVAAREVALATMKLPTVPRKRWSVPKYLD